MTFRNVTAPPKPGSRPVCVLFALHLALSAALKPDKSPAQCRKSATDEWFEQRESTFVAQVTPAPHFAYWREPGRRASHAPASIRRTANLRD